MCNETELQMLETVKNNMKEPNPLEDINLFSILNMENKEVTAHSAFLYYIFKPFKCNGKIDDTNLRIFLKALFQKEDFEPDAVNIYREVSTDFGRLDFLINYYKENKEHSIIIELKIWAGEQEHQIERYQKYLSDVCEERNVEDNIFFLTPDKRLSKTGKSKNITLKEEIKSVLETIVQERKQYPNYCAIINQYQKIISDLTGDTFMSEQQIIKSTKDIFAADNIQNIKNSVLTRLLSKFLEDLKSELNANKRFIELNEKVGARIETNKIFDKSDVKDFYVWGKASYPVIPIFLDKNKLKDDIKNEIEDETDTYFFVEIENNLYAGITLRKEKKGVVVVEQIKNEFREILNKYNEKSEKNTNLFRWSWINQNGKINFSDYGNKDESFLRFLKENTLEFDKIAIKSICEKIINLLEKDITTYFDV